MEGFGQEGDARVIDPDLIAIILDLRENRGLNIATKGGNSLELMFGEICLKVHQKSKKAKKFSVKSKFLAANQFLVCNWWGTNVYYKDKQTEISLDQLHTLRVLQKKDRNKDLAFSMLGRIIEAWERDHIVLPTLVTKIMLAWVDRKSVV